MSAPAPHQSVGGSVGVQNPSSAQVSPPVQQPAESPVVQQPSAAQAGAPAPMPVQSPTMQPAQTSTQSQQPQSAPSATDAGVTEQAAASAPVGVNPTARPNSVVDVLVAQGDITQQDLNQLSVEHLSSGRPLDQIIEEKKMVSEEVLTRARAELNNVPFITIAETGISPEALSEIAEGVARRYRMLPFALNKQDNTLSVAMVDPLDLAAIDFAQQKTGRRIIAHYALPSEVERTIAERYAQSLSSEVSQALEETGQATQQKQQVDRQAQLSGEVVRQAPITKIVETILSFAIKSRASDVHIEPQLNRTRVRYRIDGILAEKLILPKSVHEATVSRIKILSDLKIDEKRVPQDGRFNFVAENQEVDLRVSTLPTIHGEKVVMRLLKKDSTVPSLPELGLGGLALKHLQDAVKVPHGIVLVTGPTGSGKTTTLYSVLHDINTPKVNIVTLEDPVEYQMPGINQVQTNPQAGLTFASGLRSFLRQDPNVIMVGEIRDGETAELAIQASLTGHLVFSTLHTSSASGALPRMIDMGAEPFLLASSMTLTMAQRIVRKINEKYKEEYIPEPPVVEDIKKVLGPLFDAWCKQHNKDPNKIVLYRTKQDRPQTEPEYSGRVGIFEVMPLTEDIKKLILQNRPAGELEKIAIQQGMVLMKQDGYLKALSGMTTIEEVLRVAEV